MGTSQTLETLSERDNTVGFIEMEDKVLRILDANFNRAREGLRVCEEITRFILDDKDLTERFKKVRHRLTDLLISLDIKSLTAARDSIRDVGKNLRLEQEKRQDLTAVFLANIQRVKEALRVLEEFSKFIDKDAQGLEALRFNIYTLEKEAVERLNLYHNQ